jgi:DNA-binding HxlR family transcriptional regulator
METATQTVGCVEAATNILGDKWTPHLLRYFLNEKIVRFCQLQELTGGINPRTLSSRLAYLEENNIVERVIPGSSSRCEYQLTPKGQDLLPILLDMQKWGEKYDLANS